MPDGHREPTAASPRLRLHSHFEPLMVVYHNPIRLTASLLIPLFLLPEISAGMEKVFGVEGQAATFFAVMAIVVLVFLPQLLVSALDCQKVSYDFHDDHMAFTESFLLREKIRIPYRSVVAATLRRDRLQRFFNLADIVLETRPAGLLETRPVMVVIRDVRGGEKALRRIGQLLAQHEKEQARKAAAAQAQAGG